MQTRIYKTTAPIIVHVDRDGAYPLTQRGAISPDEECLMIIYQNPTLRQARIQFSMSFKMLTTAFLRAIRAYFRSVNRSHDATYRTYTQNKKDRS